MQYLAMQLADLFGGMGHAELNQHIFGAILMALTLYVSECLYLKHRSQVLTVLRQEIEQDIAVMELTMAQAML